MPLYVSLDRQAAERLREIARRERRRPQDQAAVILEHALEVLDLPRPAAPVGPTGVRKRVAASR